MADEKRIEEIRELVMRSDWMVPADDAKYLLSALDEARKQPVRLQQHPAKCGRCGAEVVVTGPPTDERIAALEQQLDGYKNYTLPNGESYDAAEYIQKLHRELADALTELGKARQQLVEVKRQRDGASERAARALTWGRE